MENVDRFVHTLLTSKEEEARAWGKQLVPAARFDFGRYKALPQTRKGEDLLAIIEKEPDIFKLPHTNCLFYCNDFLFYHAIITVDGVIEGRAALTNKKGTKFTAFPFPIEATYCPVGLNGAASMGYKERPDEDQQTITQLFFYLSDFLLALRKRPDLVKVIDFMKRSFTAEEISVMIGKPAAEVERQLQEDHVPYVLV